jgi:GT2 family glycosyltransferase
MITEFRGTGANSRPLCPPAYVADLDLPEGRLPEPPTGHGYASMFALLRLHGVPVGHVQTPILSTQHTIRDLAQTILREHRDAILRHLLADALATGAFGPAGGTDALINAAHHQHSGPWPSLTVAVCTRERPADLARCLASLERIDYPALDVLVVDNAPGTSVEQVVRRAHPAARYVEEPCPGLNWARRRAVAECTSELIAYIDDDVVVDAGWGRAVASHLAQNADVMAVTGLVVPAELDTNPQIWFERHGGFTRGYDRRWFRRRRDEPVTERFSNTAVCGVGANMTFRRALFGEVGSFDPALDAGTLTGAGGDLDMFFRILKAGYTLVYEPAALVRHRHRREEAAVKQQLENWCTGMQAYLVRSMRAYPADRVGLASLVARLLLLYYPRRVVQSLWDDQLRPGLALAELRGAVRGLWRYTAARRYARAVGARFGLTPQAESPAGRGDRRTALSPLRTVRVDLDRALPALLPGPDDSDVVQIDVWHRSRRIGAVRVVCGGYPVGRTRAVDAIVGGLWRRLLDPIAPFREALRSMLSRALQSRP